MARGVLNELDGIATQMKDYAQGGEQGLRGHVRVMANISSITQFLPAQLQSFLSRHPLVDVRLQERVSTDIARAVADNEADIGLLNNGSYGSKISLRPYRRDRLAVVMPQSHPLAGEHRLRLEQVLEHDLIGMHADSALNHLITRSAADQGLQPRLRMKVTGYDALCLMVAAGLGVGILPEGSAHIYMGALPCAASAWTKSGPSASSCSAYAPRTHSRPSRNCWSSTCARAPQPIKTEPMPEFAPLPAPGQRHSTHH
jgi:DNA-binding transcriptional LysR family regulator